MSGGAAAAATDSDSSIQLSGTTPARSHSTKRTSLVGGIPVEPLDKGGHSGKLLLINSLSSILFQFSNLYSKDNFQ